MGDYTGVFVKATLKPEGAALIEELYRIWVNYDDREPWYELAQRHPNLPWLVKFAGLTGTTGVTFGGSAYHKTHRNLEGLEWDFVASAREQQTCVAFLKDVLPRLASKSTSPS